MGKLSRKAHWLEAVGLVVGSRRPCLLQKRTRGLTASGQSTLLNQFLIKVTSASGNGSPSMGMYGFQTGNFPVEAAELNFQTTTAP
jgi:hypothetical protein